MISRAHRFHGHASLRYVYQHGRTVRAGIGTLKYARNTKRDSYRLAVVVSKKVHKSAVTRNRIRRRVYEAVRMHESHIHEPFDLVITIFSESVATMPADQLQAEVNRLLHEAEIISK